MEKQETKKTLGKFQIFFFVAFGVATLALFFWQFHWPTARIEVGGNSLSVLVARTPRHQYRGLGGRETLAPYDGMLFLFPLRSKVGIVMRDMEFPIDIIWIDEGRVIDMAQRIPLEPGVKEEDLRVYYPRTFANVVLEVPAGWVEAHHLRLGDPVRVINTP